MAEIISFSEAVKEKQDGREGAFAPLTDGGELKDVADWDARDWQELFEEVFFPLAAKWGVSVYELLAHFVGTLLSPGAPTPGE